MSGTIHLIENKNKDNLTNLSFYNSPQLPQKHNHIEIIFNKFRVIYNDPRRFGFFQIIRNIKDLKKKFLHLGPEPFNKQFNLSYFKKFIKDKNRTIKDLLLDQKFVSGIGNIYASESLFLAEIKPNKISKKLTKANCFALTNSIKKVLKNAIKKGGSTINDYITVDGKKGYFQYDFKVYGRTSLPCHICRNKILQIKINQRSSFYCKTCQK